MRRGECCQLARNCLRVKGGMASTQFLVSPAVLNKTLHRGEVTSKQLPRLQLRQFIY
ncbi:hypothetical protein D9M70_397410 [compost metagenome]